MPKYHARFVLNKLSNKCSSHDFVVNRLANNRYTVSKRLNSFEHKPICGVAREVHNLFLDLITYYCIIGENSFNTLAENLALYRRIK